MRLTTIAIILFVSGIFVSGCQSYEKKQASHSQDFAQAKRGIASYGAHNQPKDFCIRRGGATEYYCDGFQEGYYSGYYDGFYSDQPSTIAY